MRGTARTMHSLCIGRTKRLVIYVSAGHQPFRGAPPVGLEPLTLACAARRQMATPRRQTGLGLRPPRSRPQGPKPGAGATRANATFAHFRRTEAQGRVIAPVALSARVGGPPSGPFSVVVVQSQMSRIRDT